MRRRGCLDSVGRPTWMWYHPIGWGLGPDKREKVRWVEAFIALCFRTRWSVAGCLLLLTRTVFSLLDFTNWYCELGQALLPDVTSVKYFVALVRQITDIDVSSIFSFGFIHIPIYLSEPHSWCVCAGRGEEECVCAGACGSQRLRTSVTSIAFHLTEPRAHWVGLLGWLANLKGHTLPSPFPLLAIFASLKLGFTDAYCPDLAFYMGTKDPNSGPQAPGTNTFPVEQSPQPSYAPLYIWD